MPQPPPFESTAVTDISTFPLLMLISPLSPVVNPLPGPPPPMPAPGPYCTILMLPLSMLILPPSSRALPPMAAPWAAVLSVPLFSSSEPSPFIVRACPSDTRMSAPAPPPVSVFSPASVITALPLFTSMRLAPLSVESARSLMVNAAVLPSPGSTIMVLLSDVPVMTSPPSGIGASPDPCAYVPSPIVIEPLAMSTSAGAARAAVVRAASRTAVISSSARAFVEDLFMLHFPLVSDFPLLPRHRCPAQAGRRVPHGGRSAAKRLRTEFAGLT